jgi:hypothetical protein
MARANRCSLPPSPEDSRGNVNGAEVGLGTS